MDIHRQLEEVLSLLTPLQFEELATSLAAQGLGDELGTDALDPETVHSIARQVWQILEQAEEAAPSISTPQGRP